MVDRDELAGRSVGEFVLRERIGEGGFGAVYRCEQPLLGREAVVKVLHHRLRAHEVIVQRFLREARIASRLDHPYAAHVYAFGIEPDGLLWIAMEMVHGITLDRWLRDRGPLPLADLVPFFERIAEVVQTAHEAGIVHRDLKPANIMVIERAGRLLPKLLDLGIAKLVAEEPLPHEAPRGRPPHALETGAMSTTPAVPPRSDTLTASYGPVHGVPLAGKSTSASTPLGSPPYMAPELWNDGPIGPPADVYALGVLAYEALAGRRPFVATTVAAFADIHRDAPVPPLGGALALTLDEFFARALAKSPHDRPATALELAAARRVASGLADPPVELPRLAPGVRDAWLADGPQPLADAVAALDGARNVHQARDSAREVMRGLVRYLLVLALSTRSQVRDDRDDPVIREQLRELKRRELDTAERVRLLRLLIAPFAARHGTHPVPALVDLVAPRDGEHDRALDAILELEPATGDAGDDVLRARLARYITALGRLLRAAGFVLDYPLIVARDGRSRAGPERSTAPADRWSPCATRRSPTASRCSPIATAGSRCCCGRWSRCWRRCRACRPICSCSMAAAATGHAWSLLQAASSATMARSGTGSASTCSARARATPLRSPQRPPPTWASRRSRAAMPRDSSVASARPTRSSTGCASTRCRSSSGRRARARARSCTPASYLRCAPGGARSRCAPAVRRWPCSRRSSRQRRARRTTCGPCSCPLPPPPRRCCPAPPPTAASRSSSTSWRSCSRCASTRPNGCGSPPRSVSCRPRPRHRCG